MEPADTAGDPMTSVAGGTSAEVVTKESREAVTMQGSPMAGRLALVLSGVCAVAGAATSLAAEGWWAELMFHVGVAAFVGCATNALAIKALFDPWPSRRLALWGTGIIRGRADEIAREVGNAVGEHILSPDDIIARSREAIDSAIASGCLDNDELFFAIRDMIEESGGALGKLGNLTGVTDYDALTHDVVDAIRKRLTKLSDPSDAMSRLLERGALLVDVESIVREKIRDFGPQGLRDLAHSLTRRHLVWLEVWGAVFGGLVGVPMWLMSRAMY